MDEPPVWPFRPQAIAVYRDGRPDDAARSPLRAARWPLAALVGLVLGCLAFAAVVRIPQAVHGTVVGTDGPHLVAVVPGRLAPAPEPGAPATLRHERGRATLRVVRVEVVVDAAAARRWKLPPEVPRPVTVVLLTGHPEEAFGQLSVRVADPTLLQLLPGLGRTMR